MPSPKPKPLINKVGTVPPPSKMPLKPGSIKPAQPLGSMNKKATLPRKRGM